MNDGPRLDLHVHSRHSPDSRLPLEALVDQLGPAGLDGFALTDHNTVKGHAELAELARRFPRYLLVPGIEISTQDGHLLAFGVAEVPPLHRPVEETVRWVREHHGVPVPSHPFRWSHGIGRRRAERLDVPALETVNGHSSVIANAKAELLAARRGLGATGGSDVHELRDLGRSVTQFPEGTDGVDGVLAALARGRSEATGRSITVPERLRLAVRTSLLRMTRGFRPI